MVNLFEIIKRVKKHLNIKYDKEYADMIGISPADLSKRIKTGTLLPLIVEWGVANKVNLHYLLTGEGKMIRGDKKGSLYNKVEDEDPEIADLLSRTVEILKSGTDYSFSLSANIRSFHHAVELEKRLGKMENEIGEIKSHIKKDRRKQVRRQEDKGPTDEVEKRRSGEERRAM